MREYYKINPSRYLFGKSDTPEESIRQWFLYELIDSYGYPISSLETEYKIQVGSKTLRGDIVVVYEGKPILIIECKKYGDVLDDAREQLKSYMAITGCSRGIATNGCETIFIGADFYLDYGFMINSISSDILDIHKYFNQLGLIMKSNNIDDLYYAISNSIFSKSNLCRVILACSNFSNLLSRREIIHIEGQVNINIQRYVESTGIEINKINTDKIINSDDLLKFINVCISQGFGKIPEDEYFELYMRLLELSKTNLLYPRDKYLIYQHIYNEYLTSFVNYPMFKYHEYSSRFKELINA